MITKLPVVVAPHGARRHAVDAWAETTAADGSLFNFTTLCGLVVGMPDQWVEQAERDATCANCQRSILARRKADLCA